MRSTGRFVLGGILAARDAVLGTTQVVEGVHSAVLDSLGHVAPVPKAIPGITQLVYQSIRGVTSVVGQGAEAATAALGTLMPGLVEEELALAPWQLHLLSGCNAAFGDHFERAANAWALPMSFWHKGQPLLLAADLADQIPDARSHLVVFIHGLGMNEAGWRDAAGWSYAQSLETDHACTTLFLRYNTGRHIYRNGEDLAQRLDALLQAYPVPVTRLTLVGHSMGGLVSRSACYTARLQQYAWLEVLEGVVCLGSPHQGAALENIGNWVTSLLKSTPYSAPFALLGKCRSAGIKDLRHGSLRPEDWVERDIDDTCHFVPHPVPLVEGVRYLFVAGSLAEPGAGRLTDAVGDGLVSVDSALNPHTGSDTSTHPAISRQVFTGTGHMKLLREREIGRVLEQWLEAGAARN